MIEAWRDYCAMGSEGEDDKPKNGDNDDASQQDAASVSKDFFFFLALT